ncbi:MAG TPA: hypothetical protein VI914_03005 [Thermodesulfobacteriota bacterium]|nr:hypothetical protein [Thermodesulfobacteriota bacterium]
MRKDKGCGFNYYLSREIIEDYKKKPPELKLKWLYAGNLLRKSCPERIIRLQNKFRGGKV